MNLNWYQEGKSQTNKMVFIHGFFGSGRDFTSLMQSLSSHFHCIAPDLPGHGQSLIEDSAAVEGLISFGDVASLILEELASEGIRKFVLYGYSMGGRIAQSICLQAPERISHLILESASFGIRNEAERGERYRKDCRLLAGIKTDAEFRRFLEKWHHLPLFSTLRQSPLLEDLLISKQNNDLQQLEHALTLMSVGNQAWFASDLDRTYVPITYFYGEQDIKYKTIARDVKADIPRISLKGFGNASHNIHLQFLPEVVSALNNILI